MRYRTLTYEQDEHVAVLTTTVPSSATRSVAR